MYENKELVTVKSEDSRNDCKRCTFAGNTCNDIACTIASRADGISVFFVPVEKYLLMRVKGQV